MCRYPMIDLYVTHIKRGKQPTTIQQTEEKLVRIFANLEENFGVTVQPYRIEGLDGTVLTKWYGQMEHLSTATVNNYVCMLNPFLRWAATMDKNDIPFIYKDLSRVLNTRKLETPDSSDEKYMSAESVDALLNLKKGWNLIRDTALIALFLGSGLRVTEVCDMTIGSIMDQPRGIARVRRKGGDWKNVNVADYVYDHLEKYLATRPDAEDHTRPLFVTTHGLPCSRNQIYKALSKKQKQMGVATGPHALRHTFVSETEKIGGAGVARDLANHKSIVVTNRYDHTTHEQRAATVNSLPWAK